MALVGVQTVRVGSVLLLHGRDDLGLPINLYHLLVLVETLISPVEGILRSGYGIGVFDVLNLVVLPVLVEHSGSVDFLNHEHFVSFSHMLAETARLEVHEDDLSVIRADHQEIAVKSPRHVRHSHFEHVHDYDKGLHITRFPN